MPATASKESKRNNKKKKGGGGGSGLGAGRRWEMPQGEKRKSTQRIYVNAKPVCTRFSGERRARIPVGELCNYSIINLCSSADHTGDFKVIKLQIKSG